MDKFAHIKCIDKVENIYIKSKLIRILPKYFKDKYIIKTNPFILNEIQYLNTGGYEIVLPFIKEEIDSFKAITIFNDTLSKLEDLRVTVASTDIKIQDFNSKILFMEGKNILAFFMLQAIKKALKFLERDLKYTEVLIIDDKNSDNTYNIIDAIYSELNYLTVFTERADYFTEYAKKIYADTGLNLQILEQNKSAIKDADLIINLSSNINLDYFYKRGAIYFDLCNNSEKTVEILRKREDLNIIDDLIMSYNNSSIDNSLLETVLYIKYEYFKDFVVSKQYNKSLISNIIKSNNLNIIAFSQNGNIIRKYNS